MPPRIRPITKPRCQSCRLRKVKCDYVKPTCGQCSRLSLVCQGPDSSLVFVLQTFSNGSGVNDDDNNKTIRAAAIKARPRTSRRQNLQLQLAPDVPLSLGHSQQQAVLQTFLTRFMPQTASDLRVFEFHWVTQLPEIRCRFTPLNLAVDAFAVAIRAKTDPDVELRKTGMKLYGEALRQLRNYHAKRVGIGIYEHEAALASIVLSFYESTSGDVHVKPRAHLRGVSSLLEQIAPQGIRDRRLQSTFSLVRVTMIINSILGNFQPMSEAAWCFQPWGPILQDPLHRSLDVLLHVASYRLLAIRFCRTECCAPYDLLELEERKRQIRAEFDLWYSTESCLRGSTLFHPKELESHEKDSLRKSIGYDLHFDSNRYRLAMNACWVGKLLLFLEWENVLLHMHSNTWEQFPSIVKVQHAQELAEASLFADHLCVSARQLAVEEQGILGLSSIVMPIWAAHYFFRRHGVVHRVEWCKRLLQKQRCWPLQMMDP